MHPEVSQRAFAFCSRPSVGSSVGRHPLSVRAGLRAAFARACACRAPGRCRPPWGLRTSALGRLPWAKPAGAFFFGALWGLGLGSGTCLRIGLGTCLCAGLRIRFRNCLRIRLRLSGLAVLFLFREFGHGANGRDGGEARGFALGLGEGRGRLRGRFGEDRNVARMGFCDLLLKGFVGFAGGFARARCARTSGRLRRDQGLGRALRCGGLRLGRFAEEAAEALAWCSVFSFRAFACSDMFSFSCIRLRVLCVWGLGLKWPLARA